MRRFRRPWLVVTLAAALVAGGVGLGLRAMDSGAGRSLTLPDGSTLRIEAVTVGNYHRFVNGPPWLRFATTPLPTRLLLRVGLKVDEQWTASPALVVWARRGHVPRRSHDRFCMPVLLDEHGCRFPEPREVPVGAPQMRVWIFSAWPRRSRPVRLHALGESEGGENPSWGDLAFVPPGPPSTAVWTPGPLPARARLDGDTVTLTGLRGGVAPYGLERPARAGEVPWTRLAAHVSRAGKPLPWSVKSLRISDATGNTLQTSGGYTQSDGKGTRYFDGSLCSHEAAWKVRLELTRTKDYAPEELWRLRGLRIPGDRELVQPGTVARLQGERLTLDGVGGRHARRPPGYFSGMIGNAPCATVYIRRSPVTPGQHFTLVSARDDRGRDVGLLCSSESSEGPNSFDFVPEPSARSLDVTFALHRSRFVEFTVRPAPGRSRATGSREPSRRASWP